MTRSLYKYYFLVRAWNNIKYFDFCIDSLLKQIGDFTIIYIDDCSDYTRAQKAYIRSKLKGHIILFNKERKFSLRNAYEAIHTYVKEKNSIILNVDGDDWLIENDVVQRIDSTYSNSTCILTYGNCIYYGPNTPLHNKLPSQKSPNVNKRYPKEVEQSNSYRKNYFLPLHLRTWKASAFKKIKKDDFLRPDGSWLKFCEDQAIFFPLLEMSNGNYEIIEQPLYSYNIGSNFNENKRNHAERLFDEIVILRKNCY